MKRIPCLLALLATVSPLAVGASTKPATLKLATAMGDVTLELQFEKGGKLNVTSKGTPVRAGTYWVKSLRLYKKDEKGRVWELRADKGLGSMKNLTVAPGQEKVLLLGPIITMRLGARQGKGAAANVVNLRLVAFGVASEVYFPGAYLRGKRPPAPTFKITDEDGNTLHTGRFDVAGNACRYEWRIPAGFKGRFDIEIKPTMGPFKWGVRKSSRFEIE